MRVSRDFSSVLSKLGLDGGRVASPGTAAAGGSVRLFMAGGAAAARILLAAAGSAAFADTPVTPVETETVSVAPVIKTISLSGTVSSPQASQLSTAVEGLVSRVHYDSGAKVAAGEILLELDAEIERAALEQATARVKQAEAEVADAERRLKIAATLASRSYGTQNEKEAREAEVEIDKAALASFKAEEARRAAILERHILRAPYAGVIARRMAEVGQWLVPGTAAFELVAMEGFRIDVPVPQSYFARIGPATRVSVSFEALPGEQVPARIGAIIPVSDADARTFTLRVLPRREDIAITPGMSAQVAIDMDTGQRDVVVSRDALIRYPDGRVTVWVLEQDGDEALVKERRVEIGLAFDGKVQIRSGLKEGDRVVVRGNESLRDGQAVRLAS